MEREKPIRFTGQQLRIATENYSNLLGSGGFGMVYKGIFNNGIIVAVKVLRGSSNKKIDEQFMAEVGTIGRIHHFNLVRLYGFCFERNLIALVYEYMDNGSLDRYLFDEKKTLEYEKLHEIAIGIQYRDGVEGKWQQIWQAKIPPKVKNLIWRIGRNVLQTRTRLNSRGVQFPTHCAVCTMETKTACTGYFYVQEVLNAGSEQISGNIYMQA
ncbi:unnamed protein product [Trifolium pratense]|uniref:Uncharacterized protein n=1 Tax=Trifolium pratense TaxID=57577 RepID=A0ACB0J000_TRIPR|nr:unnamed protein product [Trifolium pratense]